MKILPKSPRSQFLLEVMAVLALNLVLHWPSRYMDIHRATDPHRGSICLWSSLYSYSDSTLPIRDIFSQYGIGQAFFCQLILRDSILETVNSFNLLNLALHILFSTTLYVYLRYLLSSRLYALLAMAIIVFWQFLSAGSYPSTLDAPSMGIYRYPLLPLIALIFIRYQRNSRMSWFLALTALAALQLFWITDAGICIVMALTMTLALFPTPSVRSLFQAFKFGCIVLLLTITLAGTCYGWDFIRIPLDDFTRYLRIYGALGYGAASPILKFTPNYLFINFWSFFILLATFLNLLLEPRTARNSSFFFLTLFGLVLRLKLINRISGNYIFADGVAVVACAAYWLPRISKRSHALAVLLTMLCITYSKDPLLYSQAGLRPYLMEFDFALPRALRSWYQANRPIWPFRVNFDDFFRSTKGKRFFSYREDRQLIISNSNAGEKVFLFANNNDWIYLLEARRAPGLYYLPFDSVWEQRPVKRLLTELPHVEKVFVHRNWHFPFTIPYKETLFPLVQISQIVWKDFCKKDEGRELILMVRCLK